MKQPDGTRWKITAPFLSDEDKELFKKKLTPAEQESRQFWTPLTVALQHQSHIYGGTVLFEVKQARRERNRRARRARRINRTAAKR